jgi:hypothetical protein
MDGETRREGELITDRGRKDGWRDKERGRVNN